MRRSPDRIVEEDKRKREMEAKLRRLKSKGQAPGLTGAKVGAESPDRALRDLADSGRGRSYSYGAAPVDDLYRTRHMESTKPYIRHGKRGSFFPELSSAMPDEYERKSMGPFGSPVDIHGYYDRKRPFDALSTAGSAGREAADTIRWEDENRPRWSDVVARALVYDVANDIGDLFPMHYVGYALDTGSMEPLIKGGNILVFKQHDGEELEEGDIISFARGDGRVTHRIAEVTPEGYITKGDNTEMADSDVRMQEDIKGKYLFQLPLGEIPFFRDIAARRTERWKMDQWRMGQ